MKGFLQGKGNGSSDGLFDTPRTKVLREIMVKLQLEERGIVDQRVLSAMLKVPRHWFCLPGTPDDEAYGDHPLPIRCGQTISQPLMVADMLQQMRISGEETVLEIGTGSGYNAALLSCLAHRVISLEIVPELAETAGQLLRSAGYGNVEVILADGSQGWAEAAPYDAIVVTAGAPVIPAALQEQLRADGRLVIPVGDLVLQKLLVVKRTAEGLQVKEYGGCRFVPLLGKDGWQ